MNILIIGAGAYGLALSNILSDKNKILVYSSIKEEIEKLKQNNSFSDIKLSESINYTNKKEEINNIDICVIALPTHVIKQELENLKENIKNATILIASKGIYNNKFVYEIVNEVLPKNNIYVLSGPSFAIDTIKKQPIMLTLAGKNTEKIKSIFNEKYVKIEQTTDIIGTQICGTIKNTFAMGTGILEGLNASESTKAALMTKIINETKKIIKIFNGKEDTLLLSCGIGDIILTCTSKQSRNFTLGYMIGQNQDIKDYIEKQTVEGLENLKYFNQKITSNMNIEIISIIYNIVFKNTSPQEMLTYITK